MPPLRFGTVERRRHGIRVARGTDNAVRLARHGEAAPSRRVARILREAVEGLPGGVGHLRCDHAEVVHAREDGSRRAKGQVGGGRDEEHRRDDDDKFEVQSEV